MLLSSFVSCTGGVLPVWPASTGVVLMVYTVLPAWPASTGVVLMVYTVLPVWPARPPLWLPVWPPWTRNTTHAGGSVSHWLVQVSGYASAVHVYMTIY